MLGSVVVEAVVAGAGGGDPTPSVNLKMDLPPLVERDNVAEPPFSSTSL